MKKWKALVGSEDLRPIFGCSFCGPTINDKMLDLNLLEGIDVCPFCRILQEDGWTKQLISRNVKYNEPRGASYKGVSSFLRATTSIVQKNISSKRSEGMDDMVRMVFPVASYPDFDDDEQKQKAKPSLSIPTKKHATNKQSSSTKNTQQPSLFTKTVAGGDDFLGLSMKSLAKSLSKARKVPLQSDPFLTKRQLTEYSRRNLYTSHPDPRPMVSCSWCGVDKDVEKLCPICDTLREHGWSSNSNASDQCFKDHNNERYRGVKNFVLASTDYIVRAMNAMLKDDRLRLIGQYEQFSEESYAKVNEQTDSHTTPEKRQRNNHAATNDYEISTPKRSKKTTIELPSISLLLTQENGLDGVLRADLHSIYNLHFGSNANIAAKILTTLGKGDIPTDVKNETPFLRSRETMQKYSNGSDTKPSRFIGVFRVVGEESSYAVAIPEFRVDCPKPPKAATVNNGHLCLLRVGIETEQIAGQLFAYMYRVLYGTQALSDALKDTNKT